RQSADLDPLETMDDGARRAHLERKLREAVALAYDAAPRARRAIEAAGKRPGDFGLDDLPLLPITRKDDLTSLQTEEPPFAGLLAGPVARLQRMYASPGPTFVP